MAPPITYRTVQGKYLAPDGSVVAGTLRFVPSATVYDAVGNVVVPPTPLTAVLDGSGEFSIQLPCTDAAGTTPTGWVWQLSELFAGGREVSFELPTSSPSPVSIAYLTPAETVAASFSYATTAVVEALDARVATAETNASSAQASAAASAASAAASATSASIANDLEIYLMMGAL